MMDITVTRTEDGPDETTTPLILILENDPGHREVIATSKVGREVHHQHRSLTLRSQDLIVTSKEAGMIGLQTRSGSAMKIVLTDTTMTLIGTHKAEAQSTSRV